MGERQFGRPLEPGVIQWRIPDGGTPEFLWGAVVQHVHSRTIRQAIKAKGFTGLHHLCSRRSLPYEVLGGALRGDDILRMEHIGLFVWYLGALAVPAPALVERMLDAAARTTGHPR